MKKEIQNILAYFGKRKEVVTLFLFGTFATPKEKRHSDIDLAVLLDPGELKGQNSEVFKAEYYNASPSFSLRSLDIVVLNTAPASLKYEILKTGSILMDRNPDVRRYFTALTLQEYFDYKFIEEICFAALKKRLREAHG
ncbi:MAG: nucleotidyltransferase domain-containing protein [Firmicutes bacterium]|nr:nucleotidyltransferase domain-containing protein [Bacillota bacterium]